jgi:Tfp pilus assembly protein PilN
MKNIDFLPDIYRQRAALKRARWWWAGVVILFGTAISASAMAQALLRHTLYAELDALTPQYALATTQVQELTGLQTQIARAGHEASLYTFLENPWPRTQLLAEIVRPLPENVRLTQIHIGEEEQGKAAQTAGPRSKAEEDAAAKALPPEQDLAKLQDEVERRRTIIELDGTTPDVPRLHEYVANIAGSPLIAGANIKSLEAGTATQEGRTRFTLRLVVRPGYCQTGGDVADGRGSLRDPQPPIGKPPAKPAQGGGQ